MAAGSGPSTSDGAPVLGSAGTLWKPETRLYADGVVVGADGGPVVVPPHSAATRVADTGLLDPASAVLPGAAEATPEAVAAARGRSAAATVPGSGTRYAEMARAALLDIDTLLLPTGALVAAASPYWRYVWPRDAGFAAAALTTAGRHADALRVIGYVARMQEPDGRWQARYLPDDSGDVPDERGIQLDGAGWTLWAAWLWAGAVPDTTRAAGLAALRPTIVAAVRAAIIALDSDGLPAPSQDYWETDTAEPTLGSAAPLLLALRTGAELLTWLGVDTLAAQAKESAGMLAGAIESRFAPKDYPRRLSVAGRDASVSFLLPPFAPHAAPVAAAWRRTVAALAVPNGGVRPGEEWADTTTAWTPQVSLFAATAAAIGDHDTAHRFLDWLDRHRTRLGALPEKVTADGRPAAVAPLALTGATVLIALSHLDGAGLPVPPR